MEVSKRFLGDAALNANLWATTRTVALYCAFTLLLPAMANAEEYVTYTRHSHGWTIEYPADWEIDTSEANYVKISHPETGALCNITSGNTTFNSVDELADYMLARTKTLAEKQGGPVPYVIEREQIEAKPSVVGIRALIDLVPGGTSLRKYFVNSGKLTIIDCETYTSNWELVSPAYRELLESISFEETQAAIAYDAAMVAMQERNDGKAFEYLREASEGGDARAQYVAGMFLYQGRGTEKNPGESIEWLRKAAQQGQLDAQAAIWQLKLGSGVSFQSDQDAEEAFSWMRTAAENGHVESQFQFAMQLLHGNLILEENRGEALRWFLLLARQGDAHAQHEAGAIHSDDSGPEFDMEAAYGWLSLAIANGRYAAADLRQTAASHLSPEKKLAIDEKVKKCLDTNYGECDF